MVIGDKRYTCSSSSSRQRQQLKVTSLSRCIKLLVGSMKWGRILHCVLESKLNICLVCLLKQTKLLAAILRNEHTKYTKASGVIKEKFDVS